MLGVDEPASSAGDACRIGNNDLCPDTGYFQKAVKIALVL